MGSHHGGWSISRAGPSLSRVALQKTFTGAFEGRGMGTLADGAGYVVSERLAGTLDGREDSFMIRHRGLIQPGGPPRTFGNVVPGSGTSALTGITGTVEIGDDHTLTLVYGLG